MKEIKDLQRLEANLSREVQLLITGEFIFLNTLSALVDKSRDEVLKALLIQQAEQSEMHYLRLENVLKYLEVNVGTLCNEEFTSILSEDESLLILKSMPTDADHSIMQTTLKVVRYKIAGYHAAVQLSEQLRFTFITELLMQNLEEEIDMDGALSDVSISSTNKNAIAA